MAERTVYIDRQSFPKKRTHASFKTNGYFTSNELTNDSKCPFVFRKRMLKRVMRLSKGLTDQRMIRFSTYICISKLRKECNLLEMSVG